MDPSEIAPTEEEMCAHTGHVGGYPWFCVRRVGHAGVHAAEPEPGETVTWPKEGDTAPMSGFIDPYGLKPDTPYDQQQQTSTYENREARRDAVELAVQALTPLAGAYRSTDEYAEQITRMAARLGTYIRDGA